MTSESQRRLRKTAHCLLKHGTPRQILEAVAQELKTESDRLAHKSRWSVLQKMPQEQRRLRLASETTLAYSQRLQYLLRGTEAS